MNEVKSMWKYTEHNGYNSISLHDCITTSIYTDGNDLVMDFSDGFWITPVSKHNNNSTPAKTGGAQVRFHLMFPNEPFNSVDEFRTLHFLGKPLLSLRLKPDSSKVFSMFKDGKYELEFISEYHAPLSALYQCILWKKGSRYVEEFQFEIYAKDIEYCWNDILPPRDF